jgi:sugar lactone lactonase YvrE
MNTELLFLPETEALRFLPEGPYPIDAKRLSWVAIQHGPDADYGSLNLLDLQTRKNVSYPLPGRPGFAFPCDDKESFFVGCERTLGIFRPIDGQWKVLCDGIDARVEGTIINDAAVWEDYVVFGCKDLKFKEPKAGLYLWNSRKHRLHVLRQDQTCSNGKAIRPRVGGRLELLDIDTPTKQVAGYDIDPEMGTLGPRRVVLDLKKEVGFPDGALLSPNGDHIIISFYNPDSAPHGETRMYDLRTGRVQQTWITIGSPQATCPQLIMWEGGVWLIITTAVEFMPKDRRSESPLAGGIFMGKTDFLEATPAPKYRL